MASGSQAPTIPHARRQTSTTRRLPHSVAHSFESPLHAPRMRWRPNAYQCVFGVAEPPDQDSQGCGPWRRDHDRIDGAGGPRREAIRLHALRAQRQRLTRGPRRSWPLVGVEKEPVSGGRGSSSVAPSGWRGRRRELDAIEPTHDRTVEVELIRSRRRGKLPASSPAARRGVRTVMAHAAEAGTISPNPAPANCDAVFRVVAPQRLDFVANTSRTGPGSVGG